MVVHARRAGRLTNAHRRYTSLPLEVRIEQRPEFVTRGGHGVISSVVRLHIITDALAVTRAPIRHTRTTARHSAHPVQIRHVAFGMQMSPDSATALRRAARQPRRWTLWLGIALVWWSFEAITIASTYGTMESVSMSRAVAVAIAGCLLWIPQTVGAFWLVERLPITRESWRGPAMLYLGMAMIIVVVKAVYVSVTNPWIDWYTTLPPFADILVTSIANNFSLSLLVVGAGHALTYARRLRERDQQLARAELLFLKAQLQPHFLFNALNTISSTVRTEPEVATRMIGGLSTLLRHVLVSDGSAEVTLSEELDIVRAYLDIELVRFEDRLRVRWEIGEDTLHARVPHLVLQPLVENAIRHGIAPRRSLGTIEIAAVRRNGSLYLTVTDDGIGLAPATAPSVGVGLRNTRSRLQHLYGAKQAVTVDARREGGVRVELALPFRDGRVA